MANVDISNMKIEDIPEGIYRELAEEIGIDNLLAVAKIIGGAHIYFFTEEALTRPIRDQLIIREFNGANYKQLSKKYGICEMRVRQIIKEHKGGT